MHRHTSIPLSSDTETRPTAKMRRAIADAAVGDEQKGKDPSVNHLQERVAELLGKEAALWMPTGTMCNLIAIKVHTRPADAILVEGMAHILRAESAGSALSSGVLVEAMPTERGIFSSADLQAGLERLATVSPPYGPPPRLVCLEQTHNFGGGAVWTLPGVREVSQLARSRGLRIHMDGARLFNACVASGVEPSAFAAEVDSLWIDFTKGLGAPIGAVLAGQQEFIDSARRYKHVFGGAMRQAGIAAAGCLYALDHHVERLAEDHEHASLLASGLARIEGIRVRTPRPETNIVFFDAGGLGISNADLVERLAAAGVEVGISCGQIRAVTHLDVSREDIEHTLAAVRDIASSTG